ncbi:MAG: hypothetical protein JJ939_10665 [Alphaproteobacteria bacterium]|jgi:spore germination cell wall hydrolase CwlJ-like protein|nr:hypothetical protein [Rhodobiaceae bacterium]MBO6541730.1 hypothetical protein [Alphaproteobacteria bacterium]MBO6628875.1 hypothetical protein [Alphaproteobacteria bacterium]MDF1625924.1 hypothetical protein [Parvibaculaceae bacterium]|tara:strand:+ start:85 stop:498 length:414 start_codon:yes stop_codon:yes gene_type:complete
MIQFAAQSETTGEVAPLLRPVTCRELIVYARAVDYFGRGQSAETLQALAWVLLNRRRSVGDESAYARPMPGYLGEYDQVDAHLARGLGAMAQALSPGATDPTCGSTRFHHHHECPGWAAHMQLQAIAGSYLFYSQKF